MVSMTTSIRKILFAFFMTKSVINVQGDINFNIALRLHVRSGINNKRPLVFKCITVQNFHTLTVN